MSMYDFSWLNSQEIQLRKRSFLLPMWVNQSVTYVGELDHHSADEYSLSASSVDLPSVDPRKAAFAVTKGAIPRGIAWRLASFVGSLFFWPIAIPCAVDGIRTFTHHRNLKGDFLAKSLKKEGEVVAPYATYHRILFVPQSEIQKSFKVTLINLETFEPSEFQVEAEGLIS